MKLIETTARFANNPEYVRYESLLIKLAAAMAAEDEELADRLRDEMDEPVPFLNSSETQRIKGLSGDLYSLYDDESLEAFKGTREEYEAAFRIAEQKSDAEMILKLLRKEQVLLGKAQVAFLRYLMYKELGHLKPAELFLDLALRLDPHIAWLKTDAHLVPK